LTLRMEPTSRVWEMPSSLLSLYTNLAPTTRATITKNSLQQACTLYSVQYLEYYSMSAMLNQALHILYFRLSSTLCVMHYVSSVVDPDHFGKAPDPTFHLGTAPDLDLPFDRTIRYIEGFSAGVIFCTVFGRSYRTC
jgi:hypothetical protein